MPRLPFPLIAPALALALAACGGSDEPAPGGVTPEEAAALNDAAAMLDNQALTTRADDPDPAANEDAQP